jgi:hypothetical protein
MRGGGDRTGTLRLQVDQDLRRRLGTKARAERRTVSHQIRRYLELASAEENHDDRCDSNLS